MATSPWKTEHYNLLEEEWTPVLWNNGEFSRVGIRKALLQAGFIRQIAAGNPMDRVALLRFLLAVLQWCKPELSAEERTQIEKANAIPKSWLAPLASEQEPNPIFNFLRGTLRFMQHNDTNCNERNERPVADLFHELPGVTNIAHFRHIRDYQDGVCPACIAIGFLRLPPWMTMMGKGKLPGINGIPPRYFIPIGTTLFQTLIVNWPFDAIANDQPFWRPDQEHAVPRRSNPENPGRVGMLQGFTWTSRQYRIADDGIRHGTCILCGVQTDALVTKLYERNVPAGGSNLNSCTTREWRDPHVAYKENKPCRAPDSELDLPQSAGEWREIRLLSFGEGSPKSVARAREKAATPIRILATALVSRKAKAIEAINQTITAPKESAMVVLERLHWVIEQLFAPVSS